MLKRATLEGGGTHSTCFIFLEDLHNGVSDSMSQFSASHYKVTFYEFRGSHHTGKEVSCRKIMNLNHCFRVCGTCMLY
jgi:hypothetical protein